MATSIKAHLRLFGAASVVLLTGPALAGPEALNVTIDRASIVRAPDNTATVIIGNPLIADAITQKNGVMVVTGKSYGSTNIMLLDPTGAVLSETIVNVGRGNDGMVVVQRGGKRESLACSPRCEPVLAVGDDNDKFSQTASQISQRGGMSAGKTGE